LEIGLNGFYVVSLSSSQQLLYITLNKWTKSGCSTSAWSRRMVTARLVHILCSVHSFTLETSRWREKDKKPSGNRFTPRCFFFASALTCGPRMAATPRLLAMANLADLAAVAEAQDFLEYLGGFGLNDDGEEEKGSVSADGDLDDTTDEEDVGDPEFGSDVEDGNGLYQAHDDGDDEYEPPSDDEGDDDGDDIECPSNRCLCLDAMEPAVKRRIRKDILAMKEGTRNAVMMGLVASGVDPTVPGFDRNTDRRKMRRSNTGAPRVVSQYRVFGVDLCAKGFVALMGTSRGTRLRLTTALSTGRLHVAGSKRIGRSGMTDLGMQVCGWWG
jgi:hypothetical protein